MRISISLPSLEQEAPLDYEGPVWVDIDRRRVAIPDLNDSHLLAVFGVLDRQICDIQELTAFYFDPFCGPHGEMAQIAAEQEMKYHWNRQTYFIAWRSLIQEEILRRNRAVPEKRAPQPLPKLKLVDSIMGADIYERVSEYEEESNDV